MGVEVGAVLEGKITGITKFGAFVALPEGRSGLVHISEVANTFVADVNEYLSVGQAVRVRVMSVAPDGKINLSIKRADEPARTVSAPTAERKAPGRPAPASPVQTESDGRSASASPQGAASSPSADSDFEDRLRQFMKESDSRIADNRMYADRPRRGGRRGK